MENVFEFIYNIWDLIFTIEIPIINMSIGGLMLSIFIISLLIDYFKDYIGKD